VVGWVGGWVGWRGCAGMDVDVGVGVGG